MVKNLNEIATLKIEGLKGTHAHKHKANDHRCYPYPT